MEHFQSVNVSLHVKDVDGFINKIAGMDLLCYPTYIKGQTLFYQNIVRGNPDSGIKLTQYEIIDVHHSIRQFTKSDLKFSETGTILNVEVYLREIK